MFWIFKTFSARGVCQGHSTKIIYVSQKKIISSNFSARGAPRVGVNHLTVQHGSLAWSSTPMVRLHLVAPMPIRVSWFSTCRLRLTLFLLWDLSNRIGSYRIGNLLGRFYGGRFYFSKTRSRTDASLLSNRQRWSKSVLAQGGVSL